MYVTSIFSSKKIAQEIDTMCPKILDILNKDTLTKSQYSLSREGVLKTAQNQVVAPKKLRKAIQQDLHDTKVGRHKGE